MWPKIHDNQPDWKRETPTIPGDYYAMYQDNIIEPVYVEVDTTLGLVYIPGEDRAFNVREFSWWLGPLMLPPPPLSIPETE